MDHQLRRYWVKGRQVCTYAISTYVRTYALYASIVSCPDPTPRRGVGSGHETSATLALCIRYRVVNIIYMYVHYSFSLTVVFEAPHYSPRELSAETDGGVVHLIAQNQITLRA